MSHLVCYAARSATLSPGHGWRFTPRRTPATVGTFPPGREPPRTTWTQLPTGAKLVPPRRGPRWRRRQAHIEAQAAGTAEAGHPQYANTDRPLPLLRLRARVRRALPGAAM